MSRATSPSLRHALDRRRHLGHAVRDLVRRGVHGPRRRRDGRDRPTRLLDRRGGLRDRGREARGAGGDLLDRRRELVDRRRELLARRRRSTRPARRLRAASSRSRSPSRSRSRSRSTCVSLARAIDASSRPRRRCRRFRRGDRLRREKSVWPFAVPFGLSNGKTHDEVLGLSAHRREKFDGSVGAVGGVGHAQQLGDVEHEHEPFAEVGHPAQIPRAQSRPVRPAAVESLSRESSRIRARCRR